MNVAALDFDAPAKVQSPGMSQLLRVLPSYLARIGKTISAEELIIGQPITEDEFGPDDAIRTLARIGYVASIVKSKRLKPKRFPVCALMQDGAYHIILSLDEDGYRVADLDAPSAFHVVSKNDMARAYAGQYLTAAPSIDSLEEARVGKKARGHWFWRRITSQKWHIFEILTATVVANLLAVAVSLFSLQVYDRVIPNASFSTLWVLAAGAFVAITFEALLRISRGRLIDDLGRQVDIDLSAELMGKLQAIRLSGRGMGPAALGSTMREFSSIREFFTATSVGTIADIPFVFLFLGLIYMIAGPVVWVIVAAMSAIILLSLLSRRPISRISEDMQGANVAQARVLNEITYGAEAIKLHRAENRFQKVWEDLSLLISAKTQEHRLVSSRLTFLSQAVQQVAYISAVIVGVHMVLAGEFTVGAIIAVSLLTTRAISPISQLSGAISRWQQTRVALDGLDQIMQAPEERAPGRQYARRDVLRGQIDIADLRFRYGEDQDEVLALSRLSVAPGETLAVLGRNGSGKSTLLKILSGLYDFQSGEVRYDGLEIRQIDPVDLRRNMSVLTQDVTLFSGTLRENLLLTPRPYSESQIEEALRFSGLWSTVERHPMGMDMPVADGGVGLSVGQRQSLGLSRIFLADPRIVLLDEPTAAMDQTLEAEIISRMRQWLAGRTCILTTHRTEIISLCDQIAVLHGGKLAMKGPRDEVLAKLRSNEPK